MTAKIKEYRLIPVRIYIFILSSIIIILLLIWICSTLNLPETTLICKSAKNGSDIFISSPLFFSTHQIANLNKDDSVIVQIILPRLNANVLLKFKGIIIYKSSSGNLIHYGIKMTQTVNFNYSFNYQIYSDSLKTIFKIVKVEKLK